MPRHILFLRLAYQAGMCLLALVAVTLTAIDLTTEAAEWEVTADRVIYWIFVLDYVVRFSISRSKWLFVKEHPWDLLAIIPFDALFRLFRFASLGEILRLARYLDLFSYAMRFTTRIRRFFNTNGFKYICIAALVIILLGAVGIHLAEGMSLPNGGHLTHGSRASITGKYFDVHGYGVDPETELIDYDEMRRMARELQPKMIISGASAYSRIIDWAKIREICDEVGAYMFVDMAHIGGLVAGGAHPSPVPYADVVTTTTHKTLRGPRGAIILCKEELAKKIDSAIFPGSQGGPLMHVIAGKAVCLKEAMQPEFAEYQHQVVRNAAALAETLSAGGVRLVSGGTDNHLMLVDLTGQELTGKELEHRLDEVYITANKNTVPNEQRSPFTTSGLRLGTAAITTRGLTVADMDTIAECIALAINDFDNSKEKIRGMVTEICTRYPLYA